MESSIPSKFGSIDWSTDTDFDLLQAIQTFHNVVVVVVVIVVVVFTTAVTTTTARVV